MHEDTIDIISFHLQFIFDNALDDRRVHSAVQACDNNRELNNLAESGDAIIEEIVDASGDRTSIIKLLLQQISG